jgi:uncharacterized protein
MLNDDYAAAQMTAEENWQRIIRQITPEFDLKEEELWKSLARPGEPAMEKLARIYSYMDELYASISQCSPCSRGCAYCCRIQVLVSPLEAQYIEARTGVKQSPGIDKTDSDCPFLDNNICSIYPHRPFACRQHLALFDDPKWCRPEFGQKFAFTFLSRSKLKKCYNYILAANGRQSWGDIRQFFPPLRAGA